jgi:TonB-linked SusC/RagA family outer membrane protein
MKTAGLFILFLLATSVNTYSQSDILDRKVRLDITEGTIDVILKHIGSKGGFTFSYGQDIPRDKQIRLNHTKNTIGQFLDEIFNGKIYCIEYGNKLIIMQKPTLPEKFTLGGRVIDAATKKPLPGVTVFIPGTEPLIGSVSDQDGFFEITVPTGQNIIRLSCIGYESNSFIPYRNKTLNLELNPGNLELNEVEIVYYKIYKEENINSSVSKIPLKHLDKVPMNGIEDVLQGNSAGVHVVRNSGMPGASLQVKIRGMNSLINSDPIYFLDGTYIQQSSLYAVSPHDIETIEILKDASGTAKYGACAGNGVVLLHSKKGSSNRTNVTFDYYSGQQQLWKEPDLMTTEEFLNYFKMVKPDDPSFDTLETFYQTDWMKMVFHKASTEDYHLSVSRSNDKSNFYLSTGFYKQSAIIKDLEIKKMSFKVNSDHIIKPGFRIGQDVSMVYLHHKGLKEGCFLNDFYNPILGAMCMLPFRPSTDSLLTWVSEDAVITNPYDDVELANNIRKNYLIFGSLNTQIELLPKIRYATKLGFDFCYQDNVSYNRSTIKAATSSPGFIYGNTYNIVDLSYNWQHSILYSGSFSGAHLVNIKLEFEFGENKNEWIPVSYKQYDKSLNFIEDTVGSISRSYEKSGLSTKFLHHAYSGLIQYSFKNRYHIDLGIRRESIGFYTNNSLKRLSGLYPSFSLGWIFTNESFLLPGFLKYGKIRYGWGKAGISPRINYSYFAKMMRDMEYISAFDAEGHTTSSALRRQTNENFYWENMHSHNAGLDLGLFDNKFFMTIEYFNHHLKMGDKYAVDNPKPIIEILNQMYYFSIDYLPVAEMTNKGFEWELGCKHAGSNLVWDIHLNFTHLNNRIIDVEESELDRIAFSDTYDPIAVNIPGETAGSFYGYIIDRLFRAEDCDEMGYAINQPFAIDENGMISYAQPNARAGDYKYTDINDDGIIDKNDKAIIGNPFPKYTFGLFYNLEFLNFDFNVFFQGTYGNDIFNATKLWLYNPYGLSNWTRDITNSYREPAYSETGELIDEGNTNTELHRFDYYNTNRNLRVSDFYVEDGSYLRLKNIQLGYTFNSGLTKKVHIQKFRIFVCVQNLITMTNYSGLDPEVGGWGIDCGIYPQPRTYLAGVNVTF